jgi:hypothetical protein
MEHLGMLGDIFDGTNLGSFYLDFNGWRPGMMLNILQYHAMPVKNKLVQNVKCTEVVKP